MLGQLEGKNVSIHILDGNKISIYVRPRLLVSELLDVVAAHYELGSDRRYFGFCCCHANSGNGHSNASTSTATEFWLTSGARVLDHELCRQSREPDLLFRVKFYPLSFSRVEDRAALQLFYWQCRALVYSGRLNCGCDLDLFNLAALALQIERGDFESEETALGGLKKLPVFPVSLLMRHPSLEYCQKQTIAYYKVLSGMTRTDAIYAYLRLVAEQSNYGQAMFAVYDLFGLPWWLGVSLRGLALFDHGDRQHPRESLDWSALENVFHKDKRVCFDVHCDLRRPSMSRWLSPCRSGQAPATLTLVTESPSTAKNLFNFAVSQHKFAIGLFNYQLAASEETNFSAAASSAASAAVNVATAAAAAAFAAFGGVGGGGVGGPNYRRTSMEQATVPASGRIVSEGFVEAENSFREAPTGNFDQRPPLFSSASSASEWRLSQQQQQQQQQQQRSSARGPANLRDLKRLGRPAMFRSSQSVNRGDQHQQAHPADCVTPIGVASSTVADECHSLPGSQRSSSSDLMLSTITTTSASAALAAAAAAASVDRAVRLDPAACFTMRRGQADPGEHRKRLARYHELRALLADLKAQRDAKELELKRLTAQERALTQGAASSAGQEGNQLAHLSSSDQSNSHDLAATSAAANQKCVSTQFLLAVDSHRSSASQLSGDAISTYGSDLALELEELQQEIAVQKALVEAQTRLYRESKEAKQSKQLRKQRHLEYQQALDKLSSLNAKMLQLRGKLSYQEAASAAAATSDSVNDSQYNSSLFYSSSSPRTAVSLTSSERVTVIPPTPKSLAPGQAIGNGATGSGDSSRGSSARSLASACSPKFGTQKQQHPPHHFAPQPALPQQQQQQHRVTQSSLDSGFQEFSFQVGPPPSNASAAGAAASAARLSVTSSSSSASVAAADARQQQNQLLQLQQQQQQHLLLMATRRSQSASNLLSHSQAQQQQQHQQTFRYQPRTVLEYASPVSVSAHAAGSAAATYSSSISSSSNTNSPHWYRPPSGDLTASRDDQCYRNYYQQQQLSQSVSNYSPQLPPARRQEFGHRPNAIAAKNNNNNVDGQVLGDDYCATDV